MAPSAQEELTRLEKSNAPIQDQVQQAATFAVIDLANPLSDDGDEGPEEENGRAAGSGYHGRQEYVLRWLLKKWSGEGEKGTEARCCSSAWALLTRCLESVPVRNSARILQERRFGSLLRKTLEEGAEMARRAAEDESAGAGGKSSETYSKKRKHDGSPVEAASSISQGNFDLRLEVTKAVASVVVPSKASEGGSDGFQAEYMKSVIRMSTEDAAKIFKSWLNWNLTLGLSSYATSHDWLSSFIEIWSLHVVVPGNEDVKVFSKYCSEPLLELLILDDCEAPRKSQLEQLLARNVIIPSRADNELVSETDPENSSNTPLLKRLTGDILSRQPRFAPVLFNLAVRCLPPHGSRRRRPSEMAWLQTVFGTCKDSIATSTTEATFPAEVRIALGGLLKSALDCHVTLDLPLLRSIVSGWAFASQDTDWSMVAHIIKLDSNAFLISDTTDDLLQDLLSRITAATIKDNQRLIQDQLCDDVVVPLMGEFAKARNFTAFVHHWYEQLKAFEDRRTKSKPTDIDIPDTRVWEDDRLQHKMVELMESSLTVQQIIELVEWLEEKITECSSAVYVVADAIAAATSRDETIESIGEQLNKLPLSTEGYSKTDIRYRGRFWNIARRSFEWAFKDYSLQQDDLSKLASLERQLNSADSRSGKISPIVFPALFKCFCAAWSFRPLSDPSELVAWAAVEKRHFTSFIELLKLDWRATASPSKDSGKRSKCIPYQCQAVAQTIFVEYPKLLEFMLNAPEETKGSKVQLSQQVRVKQVIKDVIWIASATTPFTKESSPVPWIRDNHDVFPSLVRNMLSSELVLNNSRIIGPIIDTLLECGNHVDNPIEATRACNGFVINCLLQLPVEVFSRSNRETILKAWPPASPDPAHKDREALSYRMAPLDPAVLSLKAKMMRLPTLYKGIKFQELVDLAEGVATLSDKPKVLLPIFADLAQSTINHVLSTVDQPKSAEYYNNMHLFVKQWLKAREKSKSVTSFTMIRLIQVVLNSLEKRIDMLDKQGILKKDKLSKTVSLYGRVLVSNLMQRLQKPEKLKNDDSDRCMAVYCALDALEVLFEGLPPFLDIPKPSILALREINPMLAMRLEVSLLELAPRTVGDVPDSLVYGDTTSIAGRQSIRKGVEGLTKGLSEAGKLKIVASMLQDKLHGPDALEVLLSLRHFIWACEDSRDVVMDESEEEQSTNLSSAYSILAIKLWKVNSSRQFLLISEIMEMMLRTKPHSISQYNIDTTLMSIKIMCGCAAPSLPATRAGTIYLHLARLLHAILTSHRLKLQGRYHALTQTLTSLLRCLFILISSTTKYPHPPPVWLPRPAAPLQSHLGIPHAAAFTRLITLICSPTLSAVSRGSSSTNSLNNPTAKAKRLAAQYMPTVLGAYIQMQLDLSLRMKPEMREVLIPAVYSIFDTMNVDQRRALGESMDSGGRAILGTMVRDWTRWGKWKGN